MKKIFKIGIQDCGTPIVLEGVELSDEELNDIILLFKTMKESRKETTTSELGGGKSLRKSWSAEEIEKALKSEKKKSKTKKLKEAF